MESTKIKFSKNILFRNILAKDVGYIHFIAIGGIGMSGLAKILLELGFKVSGSDIKNNSIIKSLEDLGGIVNIGHRHENINDCSLVVVSSAIKADNPELMEAKRQNIPVIHRSQLLESLISGLGKEQKPFSIGVTGTHGKTTTSGMMAFLYEMTGLNPSFAIGGQLPYFDVNSKAGCGDYFVSELDESDGSIELYTPDISIITNLEFDHADHYEKGFEQILETFERYVNDLDENSKIIINTDDSGNLRLIERINNKQFITYSSNPEHPLYKNANYRAEIIATVPNARMKVFKKNKAIGEITLGIPGIHNISNALAVTAAALECGVDFSQITSSLEKFTGMKRRFQTVGYLNDARIIDDYAHHPTEVAATLKTAREIVFSSQKGRVVAVFQPHRFTRLANLWSDFVKSFKDADVIYLCDVYPAGEAPIKDINSENLCKEITYTKSFYVSGELEDVAKVVKQKIRENDIILTMGAGNITQLGRLLINADSSEIFLTGKELGEYKDIKELRLKAREEYRKLQKNSVYHHDLGEIKFTRIGYDKLKTSGADERKYKLIPKLKEIIKSSDYINKTPGKNPNIVASHWLINNVNLEGKLIKVGVNILEDQFGNKFYNLNQDMEEWNKKYPSVLPVDSNTGSEGYIINITDFNNNFNPDDKAY